MVRVCTQHHMSFTSFLNLWVSVVLRRLHVLVQHRYLSKVWYSTGVLSYLQMYSTTSDSSTEYWSSVIFCRVLWMSRYGTVSIYSRTYHGTQGRPVFSRVLKSSLGTHRKCSSKFFGHQVPFYVDVVQSQSQLWE